MKLKKKAILVVSVGATSVEDNGIKIIDSIEEDIQVAYSDYIIYRAFTSKFIIDRLKKNYNYIVDTIDEAMNRIIRDKVVDLIIQPTHIINGVENDIMINTVNKYKDYFKSLYIGKPLLDSHEDYNVFIDNIIKELPDTSDGEAIFLIAHGTDHVADSCYLDINNIIYKRGYNIHIGTIKGNLSINNSLELIRECNYKKIYLTPLMIVSGRHAYNDIFKHNNHSWRAVLEENGYAVENIDIGLGSYSFVRRMFVEHIDTVISR